MGLDMYLKAKKNEEYDKENEIEIGYWRKHPDLHSYIEELYRNNGGTDEFNCIDYILSEEEINDIIEKSQRRQLPISPGGFFFGESMDEDNERTVEIMTEALKYQKEGYTIYYTSWW